MKIYTYNECEYRSFTYQEEQEFAKFIMDLLSQLWVREGFHDILETIYNKKLQIGFNITENEWVELVYFLDRYIIDIDRAQIKWPEFYDDNEDIYSSLSNIPHNERSLEVMKTIQLAWKEVWLNHITLHNTADKYRMLPHDRIRNDDNDDETFLQKLRLNAIKNAMGDNPELTYPEACLFIRDYIPRFSCDLD